MEYELKRDSDNLYIYGFGMMGGREYVASKQNPMVYLTTNNVRDRVLPSLLGRLRGAKRTRYETCPWYDQSPSGRRVQRGTVDCQTWDLTEYFNN